MLRWSPEAKKGLVVLYRQLQDIDIFVEDEEEGNELFYSELFSKIFGTDIRVERVFPLKGRENVIREAESRSASDRQSLFLIDGDLDFVLDCPVPRIRNLVRLSAYCIENLLFAENAIAEILAEAEVIDKNEACRRLDFDAYKASLGVLVDLFSVFAATYSVNPSERTVGIGVGTLLSQCKTEDQDRAISHLDESKVRLLISEYARKMSAFSCFSEIVDFCRNRASALGEPLDIVSGRSFLLPLLKIYLQSITKEKYSQKSLRYRLMLHLDENRLEQIRKAVRGTVA